MRPSPIVRAAAAAAALPLFAWPCEAGPLAPIWAGAYAGIDVNAGWSSIEDSYYGQSVQLTGLAGGGHVGYNFQVGALVAGIEADGTLSRARGSKDYGYGVSAEANIDWLASLRGRAGLSIANVFVYGTGGVAIGAGGYSLAYKGQTMTEAGNTHTGFVAGGGLEARFAPGMSLRLEGLHYMFGSEAYQFDGTVGGTAFSIRDSFAPSFTTVRLGLSFTLN